MVADKRSPNFAFKCKLKIKDKRIIECFSDILGGVKFAYNYARKVNKDEFIKFAAVKKAEWERLADNPDKDTLYKEFCKNSYKDYITPTRNIRDELNAKRNAGEKGFEFFQNLPAVPINNAIVFDYERAISDFRKNYEKHKSRVEKKKVELVAKGMVEKANKLIYPFAYGFPQYKDTRDVNSFHVDNIQRRHISYEDNKIFIPGLPIIMKKKYGVKHDGYVQIWKGRQFPLLPEGVVQLSNPVISTDGIDWYLSASWYEPSKEVQLDDKKVLGIDLGLKEQFVTSDGVFYPNVSKDKKYIKLERKKRLLQRALNKNIDRSPLTKDLPAKERWKHLSNKARRLVLEIKKVQIKINDYFDYNRKGLVSTLFKDNPSMIVLEKLDIKDMQKNKRLSPLFQKTAMGKIKTRIVESAKRRGIEVYDIEQTEEFQSSQICSVCGFVEPKMKNLNKRTFVCSNCGSKIDRDINAAINLRNTVFNDNKKHLNRL